MNHPESDSTCWTPGQRQKFIGNNISEMKQVYFGQTAVKETFLDPENDATDCQVLRRALAEMGYELWMIICKKSVQGVKRKVFIVNAHIKIHENGFVFQEFQGQSESENLAWVNATCKMLLNKKKDDAPNLDR